MAPILYLVFIDHYAPNSFTTDDWTVVPLVHAALHGHLLLSQLWGQHIESRLFIGNMIDVIFGLVDRLDLRSVIFLSSALLIATYAGLLALVRQYLGKRLTPIPVLVVGVIWFSLADVSNALWALQVSWYLTLFFFVMMLGALLGPKRHRTLWFAIAVVLACAASLSTIQGFLCWPVGAICILWSRPSAGRVRPEIAVWLGAMVLTLASYLPGYNFGEDNTCFYRASCSLSGLAHHPLTALGFFMTLIGSVIPGTQPGLIPSVPVARFEVLGVVLFAVAVFILVQSWRHRASTELLPLPLLLIVFSLLFDATITEGRAGMGASGAVVNRYVMPNLILLTGIVIYGLARVPTRRPPVISGGRRLFVNYLALFALGVFLVVQLTTSTGFGLTQGRDIDAYSREEAQFFVNLNRIHVVNKSPSCQTPLTILRLSDPGATLREATQDQLGEFQSTSYRYYRLRMRVTAHRKTLSPSLLN